MVLDLIEAFHASNVLRLAVPLVLFSGLLAIARGPAALRLSDETLRSVTLTLMILLVNGYLASYLVLQIDMTEPLYDRLGLPHLGVDVTDPLPWPVTLILAVLLFDLADYWTHRLMHRSLLWGVHAVHHSEQRLTWFSASRVHLFEATIMKVGYVAALGWLGFPLWALGTANAIAYMHNRYVHCDLGWNHGRLARVIASPNWHRWHHSIEPAAYDKNFANIFPFIDVAFGTYHNPGPCRTAVGLLEMPTPRLANQLLYPFTFVFSQLRQDLNGRRGDPAEPRSA